LEVSNIDEQIKRSLKSECIKETQEEKSLKREEERGKGVRSESVQ
jgi:hypothetical protein